ncbi:MAG: hypothetical protein GY696_16495 [Gammaproteobacteria bacterium]|nr:hypothetical protein [Gammaproteobacteria bacterium]
MLLSSCQRNSYIAVHDLKLQFLGETLPDHGHVCPPAYMTVQASTPPPAETASTTWTQKLASEAGINPVEYMALTEGVAMVSSRV